MTISKKISQEYEKAIEAITDKEIADYIDDIYPFELLTEEDKRAQPTNPVGKLCRR